MKFCLKIGSLICVGMLLAPFLAHAQPPPPPPSPVDGGLLWLAGAGIAFGAKMLHSKVKKQ
jgi:hypothetical protein